MNIKGNLNLSKESEPDYYCMNCNGRHHIFFCPAWLILWHVDDE